MIYFEDKYGNKYNTDFTFKFENLPSSNQIRSVKIKGLDGGYKVSEPSAKEISVVVSGIISATTKTEANEKLNSLSEFLHRGLIKVCDDDLGWFYEGDLVSFDRRFYKKTNETVYNVVITIHCYEPYKKGYEITEEWIVTRDYPTRIEMENPHPSANVKFGTYDVNAGTKTSDESIWLPGGTGNIYTATIGCGFTFDCYGGFALSAYGETITRKFKVFIDGVFQEEVIYTDPGITFDIRYSINFNDRKKHTVTIVMTEYSLYVDYIDLIPSNLLTLQNTGSVSDYPTIEVESIDTESVFSSLGKTAGDTDHPISIWSVGLGKNLLNENNVGLYKQSSIVDDGTYLIANDGNYGGYEFYEIDVKKGFTYTLSFVYKTSDDPGHYDLVDKNSLEYGLFGANISLGLTQDGQEHSKELSFTADKDRTLFVRLLRSSIDGAVYYKKGSIMLEEGNVATSYEPYSSLLSEPLRVLPNLTKDEFNLVTGELTKNVGEESISYASQYTLYTNFDIHDYTFDTTKMVLDAIRINGVIYPYQAADTDIADRVGTWRVGGGGMLVSIRVPKGATVVNPVTLTNQLATPQISTLDTSPDQLKLAELDQAGYDVVKFLNGTTQVKSTTAYGTDVAHLIEYNLKALQSAYTSLTATEIKDNTQSILSELWAYGVGCPIDIQGDFEDDSNGDGVADGWTPVLYESVPELFLDAHQGTYSQRITAHKTDSNRWRRVEKTIDVGPYKTYTFTVYIKGDGNAEGWVIVDDVGGSMARHEIREIATSLTWTKYELEFTTANDTSQVIIRLYNTSDTLTMVEDSNWIQFDSASITANGVEVYAWAIGQWYKWSSNTTSYPEYRAFNLTNGYIQDDGKIYFLIKSMYPSDGISDSKVYLDHARLSTVMNFAKLGIEAIINYGGNLIPPFTSSEWLDYAGGNRKNIDDYTVQIKGDAAVNRHLKTYIPFSGNKPVSFNAESDSVRGVNYFYFCDSNKTRISTAQYSPISTISPPNTSYIEVIPLVLTTEETVTFKNLILTQTSEIQSFIPQEKQIIEFSQDLLFKKDDLLTLKPSERKVTFNYDNKIDIVNDDFLFNPLAIQKYFNHFKFHHVGANMKVKMTYTPKWR